MEASVLSGHLGHRRNHPAKLSRSSTASVVTTAGNGRGGGIYLFYKSEQTEGQECSERSLLFRPTEWSPLNNNASRRPDEFRGPSLGQPAGLIGSFVRHDSQQPALTVRSAAEAQLNRGGAEGATNLANHCYCHYHHRHGHHHHHHHHLQQVVTNVLKQIKKSPSSEREIQSTRSSQNQQLFLGDDATIAGHTELVEANDFRGDAVWGSRNITAPTAATATATNTTTATKTGGRCGTGGRMMLSDGVRLGAVSPWWTKTTAKSAFTDVAYRIQNLRAPCNGGGCSYAITAKKHVLSNASFEQPEEQCGNKFLQAVPRGAGTVALVPASSPAQQKRGEEKEQEPAAAKATPGSQAPTLTKTAAAATATPGKDSCAAVSTRSEALPASPQRFTSSLVGEASVLEAENNDVNNLFRLEEESSPKGACLNFPFFCAAAREIVGKAIRGGLLNATTSLASGVERRLAATTATAHHEAATPARLLVGTDDFVRTGSGHGIRPMEKRHQYGFRLQHKRRKEQELRQQQQRQQQREQKRYQWIDYDRGPRDNRISPVPSTVPSSRVNDCFYQVWPGNTSIVAPSASGRTVGPPTGLTAGTPVSSPAAAGANRDDGRLPCFSRMKRYRNGTFSRIINVPSKHHPIAVDVEQCCDGTHRTGTVERINAADRSFRPGLMSRHDTRAASPLTAAGGLKPRSTTPHEVRVGGRGGVRRGVELVPPLSHKKGVEATLQSTGREEKGKKRNALPFLEHIPPRTRSRSSAGGSRKPSSHQRTSEEALQKHPTVNALGNHPLAYGRIRNTECVTGAGTARGPSTECDMSSGMWRIIYGVAVGSGNRGQNRGEKTAGEEVVLKALERTSPKSRHSQKCAEGGNRGDWINVFPAQVSTTVAADITTEHLDAKSPFWRRRINSLRTEEEYGSSDDGAVPIQHEDQGDNGGEMDHDEPSKTEVKRSRNARIPQPTPPTGIKSSSLAKSPRAMLHETLTST